VLGRVYNGTDEDLPILLALNGSVFDVHYPPLLSAQPVPLQCEASLPL
jgi:hypothetical protein